MSRSLLPRTSRFQALKRAPRYPSSSRPSAWIMVPMAPSSTRMRSAARRRSVSSVRDMGIDIAAASGVIRPPSPSPLPCGEREWTVLAARFVAWPQAEQMTHRVNQVGAVHGVEVKIGDAAIDEIRHLLRGERGGDYLAGGGALPEAL